MFGSAVADVRFGKHLFMFVFYSNRQGCLRSLIVSLVGTVILIALMRACSGGL